MSNAAESRTQSRLRVVSLLLGVGSLAPGSVPGPSRLCFVAVLGLGVGIAI